VTNPHRLSAVPNQRSHWSAAGVGLWVGSAFGVLATAAPVTATAQKDSGIQRAEAPVAPTSAVSAIGSATTLSLLALTGLASNDQAALPPRDVLFTGVSTSAGRLGGVRFTAIGTGYFAARDAVGNKASAEGALALRARGRINGVKSWAAISYGYANALGGLAGASGIGNATAPVGLEGTHVDTTISRRVDVGGVARAEAGIQGTHHGIDLAMGLAVERATRVTTQTIDIETASDLPMVPLSASARSSVSRTTRGLQSREIATGLASMGWNTGRTVWLALITAPVASWINVDALSPRPRLAPPVASLSIVHPITAWLSGIAAASTFSSNVGNTALRDDIASSRNSNFAPVFALGLSIAHVPLLNRRGEVPLGGILSFETHIADGIDSVAFITEADSGTLAAFHVQIIIEAPSAASVELMGDATDWTVAGMRRGSDGRWRAVLNVTSGAHRLSVRTDGGEWLAPPGLPLGNSDFGNPVGLLVVERPNRRR
jgi:hypothetical protein